MSRLRANQSQGWWRHGLLLRQTHLLTLDPLFQMGVAFFQRLARCQHQQRRRNGCSLSFLGRDASVAGTTACLTLTSVSVASSVNRGQDYSSRAMPYFPIPWPSFPSAGIRDLGDGDQCACSLQETAASLQPTSVRGTCLTCSPVSATAPCQTHKRRPAACGA